MLAILVLLFAATSVIAPPALAQGIRGRLFSRYDNAPVGGGFVVLLDADSQEVGRALTDARGRFEITAPSAGEYRLQSQMIGIQTSVSPPITVEFGANVEFPFDIPGHPLAIPGGEGDGSQTCGGFPESGLPTAIAWHEAQKAIRAVAWTEAQFLLSHKAVRYERELQPSTLDPLSEQRSWHQSGLYTGSAIRSPGAERLAEGGYVQGAGPESWIYYGPDAGALLASAFVETHCFRMRHGAADSTDLMGLVFEPIPGWGKPDVAGALWIDAGAGELRGIDFEYTDPPWSFPHDGIGGHIEFERLPSGLWIVRRWWLRMPVLDRPSNRVAQDTAGAFVEPELQAIREVGGWVNEIQTVGGRALGRAGGAALSGTVTVEGSGEPLRGARVFLVGTDYRAITDENGRYNIEDVEQNTYAITFTHDTLEALGFVPPPTQVVVGSGALVTADLSVPSSEEMWRTLCPEIALNDAGGGIITGFVRDKRSDAPIAEASVVIGGGTESDSAGDSAAVSPRSRMTDWTGYYRICNVPTNRVLTVTVVAEGWEQSKAELLLDSARIHAEDFELTERQTRVLQREATNVAVGLNFGVTSPGGDGGQLIGDAFTLNGVVRLMTVTGFQLGAGVHYGTHQIEAARDRYRQLGFYVEPRFAFGGMNGRLVPYLGVRTGIVLESVWEGDGGFSASGYELGATAGITLRIDRRIRLDAGFSLGRTSFGDFKHTKTGVWSRCLTDVREQGLDLPHVIQLCSPPGYTGAAIALEQPETHPGSGRVDRMLGVWFGVVIPILEHN